MPSRSLPALVKLRLYQVDAFAHRPFTGNPAAVCPLDAWIDDATMLAIAAENNLSETAFFVREGDGFALRWFTPKIEVELCGHATLASAFVILTRLLPGEQRVRFSTRFAGDLSVERQKDRYILDLPNRPPTRIETPSGLEAALGVAVRETWRAKKTMAVLEDAVAVRAVEPDLAFVAALPSDGLIVTARGDGGVDFVSRYFAPHAGIDEDPVTGSAHATLVPYWAEVLRKRDLFAQQLSARGGELSCTLDGPRVRLGGGCVLYLEGSITI